MNERRREQRFEVAAPAALTALESVAANLPGQVLNVSSHGVKIRVSGSTLPIPRVGELYRIRSASDRMLCRVTHSRAGADGTEIGFHIVYWNEAGELNRVVADHLRTSAPGRLRDLRIPALA